MTAQIVTLARTLDQLTRILDDLQHLPIDTAILTRDEQQVIDRTIQCIQPIADRLDNALAEVIEP